MINREEGSGDKERESANAGESIAGKAKGGDEFIVVGDYLGAKSQSLGSRRRNHREGGGGGTIECVCVWLCVQETDRQIKRDERNG